MIDGLKRPNLICRGSGLVVNPHSKPRGQNLGDQCSKGLRDVLMSFNIGPLGQRADKNNPFLRFQRE